jgi:Protein of unknown function (DUF3828)
MRLLSTILGWSAMLELPCLLFAQGKPNNPREVESVRSFVSEFYQWYVPKTLEPHSGPAWDLALKHRSRVFSSELFRALKEDSNAQAKASGEIVGLDFDPFLNTQDPCERYEVGSIVPEEQTYRVEVFGTCSGTKKAKPDVLAQVELRGGHWVFTNFLYPNLEKEYPNSANLLATLKALRQEREGGKPRS